MAVEIRARFNGFSRRLILKNTSCCATAWKDANEHIPVIEEAEEVRIRVMKEGEPMPSGLENNVFIECSNEKVS